MILETYKFKMQAKSPRGPELNISIPIAAIIQ